jgi:lysyl-tRNA synthetase class 1
MLEQNNSRYWLDHIVSRVLKAHPKGEIIISSGISPSGPYHVGHAREILTADALRRGLVDAGRQARHLHFVDDFDVLRKRYPYLEESYENEVGKPLYSIPAPDGRSESYGQQFFSEYFKSAELLGVEMEVLRANELYGSGKFKDMIVLCLQKRDAIAKILLEISGRAVGEDWQPIQILDKSTGKLNTAKFLAFETDAGTVSYESADGNRYTADMAKGEVKLDWRLDWPARWALYGVQAEGFGREHATKGGSYDTGKVIAEEIFGIQPPIPVPYDIISLKGENKKMSSSLGNLITLSESLEIIPPEILRYFTFKSRPDRQLNFDPEIGLYNLMDEYAKTESETMAGEEPEFKRAWEVANLSGKEHVISSIPFSHIVTVYQTANGEIDLILDLLTRTGHSQAVKDQEQAIIKELRYVDKWLEMFAPEKVKFNVLKEPTKLKLSDKEQNFLVKLKNRLESNEMLPELIHNSVYESAVEQEIKPAEAFRIIYRLFLGKDYGPKLGFFLSCLDKEFVLRRLAREK